MVGIIAAGAADSLLATETARSRYLPHWYILSTPLVSGTDCDEGPSGIDKKLQYALLCQEFESQHISLDDLLREKSDDQTYPHAEFVKNCLEEKVDVPRELKINLLDRKIHQGIEEGKKWSLVHGFPKCMQDLHEFEEKVGLNHRNFPAYIL